MWRLYEPNNRWRSRALRLSICAGDVCADVCLCRCERFDLAVALLLEVPMAFHGPAARLCALVSTDCLEAWLDMEAMRLAIKASAIDWQLPVGFCLAPFLAHPLCLSQGFVCLLLP